MNKCPIGYPVNIFLLCVHCVGEDQKHFIAFKKYALETMCVMQRGWDFLLIRKLFISMFQVLLYVKSSLVKTEEVFNEIYQEIHPWFMIMPSVTEIGAVQYLLKITNYMCVLKSVFIQS